MEHKELMLQIASLQQIIKQQDEQKLKQQLAHDAQLAQHLQLASNLQAKNDKLTNQMNQQKQQIEQLELSLKQAALDMQFYTGSNVNQLQESELEKLQKHCNDLQHKCMNALILKKSSKPSDSHLCLVCMDLPKNIMFKPCNHISVCEPCATKVTECVICRKKITKKEKVYL